MISQSYAVSRARRGGGLLELVISAQDLESSDPLDRVYGVLGMLPVERAYLQPDYSRTVLQLYIDLIIEGVNASQSLGYISTGGIGHRTRNNENTQSLISELPSWVPDFKQRVRPIYLCHPMMVHMPEFQASAESHLEYQFLSENTVLEAKGFICDTIRKVSLPFVDDFLANTSDLLENSTEIAEEMLRNVTQSLKNCIETIDLDNHTYPLEFISWRQALYRSILLYTRHINADEEGNFHCNTCSDQYGVMSLGYMLLLADIGYAELATPSESSSTDIPLRQVQDIWWRYFESAPNSSELCPELAPDSVEETWTPIGQHTARKHSPWHSQGQLQPRLPSSSLQIGSMVFLMPALSKEMRFVFCSAARYHSRFAVWGWTGLWLAIAMYLG
jgi:hypothetical protein